MITLGIRRYGAPQALSVPLSGPTLRRLLLAVVLVLMLVATSVSPAAQAATPLDVATARSVQDGSSATVRGYVVGQPTSSSTVLRSGFPNNYALALADSAATTDVDQMIFVQIPAGFRDDWGLGSNPGLLGERIDVTGSRTPYFSAPGLKSSTAFARVGGSDPDPDPDPSGGTTAYDSTYWSSALDESGPDLEAELHRIISADTERLSYSQVWAALRETDEDPADPTRVIELYSGNSVPETTNGGGVDDWNREHVWAKSHGDFGTATGPGTDIHHLRPTDVTVNSDRGNLDFDEADASAVENSEAPGNFRDADSWEPRDEVKGDVARMIFYMSVRYEGGDGFADLEVNDLVGNGSTPRMGRLSVLLAWNAQDPPSSSELRRNDVIFTDYQFNRNPFIDHPEWADAIWN